MDITPISKEAFAVLAECEETRKPFGITIDPLTKCQTPCDNKARFFLCQLMTTVLLPEVGRRCSSCP